MSKAQTYVKEMERVLAELYQESMAKEK